MPSSLSRVLSSALGYSPRPPVSVCGTVTTEVNSAGAFLGSMGSLSSWALSALLITSRRYDPPFVARGLLASPPTGLNRAIHQPGSATLLRPSCGNHPWWCRNINLLPITYAFRPRLRDRLTLGRLTLPRNPWAYGERVSHSFYRYSSLHKLFQALQRSLPSDLRSTWNARLPLPSPEGDVEPAASVPCFSPVTFSAQARLTSELLRFL